MPAVPCGLARRSRASCELRKSLIRTSLEKRVPNALFQTEHPEGGLTRMNGTRGGLAARRVR